MPLLEYLSSAFLQPKTDRPIHRTIRELRPRRIVEIGIGNGERTSRIIHAACQHNDVVYCGIDMFEAAPAETPHLSLKDAHRKLASLPAEVRLLPGNATITLQRHVNELPHTDLLVIDASQSDETLETVWTYAPRMLANDSRLLIQDPERQGWQSLRGNELPSFDQIRGRRPAA